VQMTPPGSECSITIGIGITDAEPGSYRGTHLVVTDIEAARARTRPTRRRRERDPAHGAKWMGAGPGPRASRLRLVRRLPRPRRQQMGLAGEAKRAKSLIAGVPRTRGGG